MARELLPPWKPGQPISARRLNRMQQGIERSDRSFPGYGGRSFACGSFYASRDQDNPHTFIAWTPEAGIPACTGDYPVFYPGHAECDEFWWDFASAPDMSLIDSGFVLEVYNTTRSAVQGGRLIQGKYIGGVACIDVEDCYLDESSSS